MKSAKTPKAPDYTSLANQQAATAKQNWQENLAAARPNQVGPEGTNTWAKDANGNWLNTVAMTPERQQLYDTTNQKAQEQMSGFDTSQVDLSGAPAMPTVGGHNQQVIDTMRALQRPELDRTANAARARAIAKGIPMEGSSAGTNIENQIGQNMNDADLKAILAGVNQGNTEFTQGMNLHTTGTGDILNQNTANLQKVGGMMGQSNSFRMPTFGPAPTPGMPGAATPDTMGAAQANYNAAVEKANAKNASNPWNQIVGIGSTLAGAYLGGPGGAQLGSKIGGMMRSDTNPTPTTGYDFSGTNGGVNGFY